MLLNTVVWLVLSRWKLWSSAPTPIISWRLRFTCCRCNRQSVQSVAFTVTRLEESAFRCLWLLAAATNLLPCSGNWNMAPSVVHVSLLCSRVPVLFFLCSAQTPCTVNTQQTGINGYHQGNKPFKLRPERALRTQKITRISLQSLLTIYLQSPLETWFYPSLTFNIDEHSSHEAWATGVKNAWLLYSWPVDPPWPYWPHKDPTNLFIYILRRSLLLLWLFIRLLKVLHTQLCSVVISYSHCSYCIVV